MLRYLGPKLKKLKYFNLNIQPGFSSKYCIFKNNIKFNKIIISFYSLELAEKQKLKIIFSLSERFIKNYIKYISKYKYKKFNISFLLNKRLDSILFDLGFCISLSQARHFINHGYLLINYKLIRKPSFLIYKNDVINISNKSYYINNIIKKNIFNKYYKYINIYNLKMSLCLNTLTAIINSNLAFLDLSFSYYNNSLIHHFYNI